MPPNVYNILGAFQLRRVFLRTRRPLGCFRNEGDSILSPALKKWKLKTGRDSNRINAGLQYLHEHLKSF